MREQDIVFSIEGDLYWVARYHKAYTVYRAGRIVSTADSSYAKTPDGLSIAIARCRYLAHVLQS